MSDTKLVDFLLDNNVAFKERENSVTLKCPRCKKEKLDIHKTEFNFICYYCAEKDNLKGWNASSILAEITGLPQNSIKEHLSGNNVWLNFDKMMAIRQAPIEPVKSSEIAWAEGYYALPADISKPGVEYLLSRGITKEHATRLKIRYNPGHKQVAFPVLHENKLVGYQGRSVDPNVPKERSKYNLPGFKKSDFLMFEQTITNDSVIMCEGPVSAMKFDQASIGYVATMGKYVSTTQMELLQTLKVKNVYLGLDRDAWKETKKLIEKHMCNFNFFLLEVPEHRDDFGDCTYEECALSYTKAQPMNFNTLELKDLEITIKGFNV